VKSVVRLFNILILPLCWFAPASFLRVFFHRLRGVRIGRGVEIGYFVVIDHVFPNKVWLGDNSVITVGVKILAHDDAKSQPRRSSRVIVGEKAFVGVNAVLLPGIKVGRGAIIGAQSLVNRSVKDNDRVAGVPARSIKKN
jgi:acetyltransferase-like isoleucine patch superfamily enzyme